VWLVGSSTHEITLVVYRLGEHYDIVYLTCTLAGLLVGPSRQCLEYTLAIDGIVTLAYTRSQGKWTSYAM